MYEVTTELIAKLEVPKTCESCLDQTTSKQSPESPDRKKQRETTNVMAVDSERSTVDS